MIGGVFCIFILGWRAFLLTIFNWLIFIDFAMGFLQSALYIMDSALVSAVKGVFIAAFT